MLVLDRGLRSQCRGGGVEPYESSSNHALEGDLIGMEPGDGMRRVSRGAVTELRDRVEVKLGQADDVQIVNGSTGPSPCRQEHVEVLRGGAEARRRGGAEARTLTPMLG